MRRRLLVVLGIALFAVPYLFDFGPGVASADTFTGQSGSVCDATQHVVFSMPLDGTVATATILQTKVVVNAGAIVKGYWILSNGSTPGFKYWQGPATFFSWYGDGKAGSNYLRVNITQGTTGTLRFIMAKTGDYGGCWSVSNTGIEVLRYQSGGNGTGGGGGGLVPTPTPDPSASPSPSPDASTPGYCPDPDYDPTIPGTGPYIPCETPGPTPTPTPDTCVVAVLTPGASATTTCSWYYPGNTRMNMAWSFAPVPGRGSGDYMANCTVGHTGSGTNFYAWVNLRGAPNPQTGTLSNLPAVAGTGYIDVACTANSSSAPRGGTLTLSAPVYVSGPSFTPAPSATATPDPTLPPSFAPSFPPPPSWPQDEEGNAIDCTAAEWVNKAICEDVPDYSFGAASMAPDGVAQLVEQLKGKAPFGYGYQAVDALGDGFANAAGAALPACVILGTGQFATEVCLPLGEVSDALSPYRTVFLAMVLIAAALSLIRLAQHAAGGGTSSGGSGA